MSHEINDNVKKAAADTKGDGGLNLLSVNEGDRNSSKGIESTEKALEENEKQIAAVIERIAEIAKRALALSLTDEPHHLQTIRDCATKGAANNEPAHLELQKHLK